ncbi:hypothetical protein M9Y10_015035 [Tritrichomonas musculus]|uniref:Rab-GAP TBC domain-containing protein n=1 Tax=Tritrichomonas musculus TaxID=1915356 RepID=A0ABR2L164_9EUKA
MIDFYQKVNSFLFLMNTDFLRTRNEFLDFFPNCTGSSLYITPKLLKSESDGTIIHSAIWKFYLIIAPSISKQYAKDEDWIRILKEKRSEFFTLRDKHFIKAPDVDDDDKNAAGTDPLLNAQSTEWSQFYKDQDLRQQIRTDTARAFQELEFYQKQENQDILEDLLFLFCRTHPSYGYPQGLHELAAFILHTFHEEMIATSDDTISFIFSSSSIVPDAYCVFAKLAELLGPFYNADTNSEVGPNSKINLTIVNSQDLSEICNYIQTNIIERGSPELAKALANSGIQPHTYMMKWMRLLFLSVFDFSSCKTMWDIIIAYLPNLDIITYTCASLLLNSKDQLYKCDSNDLLQILFHYPNVPNAWQFVVKAVDLYNKYTGKNKGSHNADIVTIVAERLNELSRGLNEICTVKGYECAMPYVMDLRRTRDILLGILPADEMLPLEMALELFKPQKVEYKPVEVIVDSFDRDNRVNKKYKEDLPAPPRANANSNDKGSILPPISSSSTHKVKTDLLFAEDTSSSKSKGKQKSTSIMRKCSDTGADLFGDNEPKVEGETLLNITTNNNNKNNEDSKNVKKPTSIKIKTTSSKTSKTNTNNDEDDRESDPLLVDNRSKPIKLPSASSSGSRPNDSANDILFGGTRKQKSTPSSLFDDDDNIIPKSKPKPAGSSLFDDSDNINSSTKKKTKKKKSLFDDADGDDLFS